MWRGGVGIEPHVASARAVIGTARVFAQMPEGTVSGPPGRIGPFRSGWALIALRTGAPIVPLAMAGTEELYLGKRMASRVLPPTSRRELLGPGWDGVAARPRASREELELAKAMSAALAARARARSSRSSSPSTVDPPGHPRRLRVAAHVAAPPTGPARPRP